MNRPAACEEFEALAEDVALGFVDEPRRSVLLGHAASCLTCDALLSELTLATDRLLHLAPEVEPPAGFETRAVAAMAPRVGARQRPRGAALIAVAAVLLGLLGGLALGRTLDRGDASLVTSGPILTASGARIGMAELEAEANRIVLTMDHDSSWPGLWRCDVADGHGGWVEVGSWTADDVTNGVWAAGLDGSLVHAREMRIRDDRGSVVATAVLRD